MYQLALCWSDEVLASEAQALAVELQVPLGLCIRGKTAITGWPWLLVLSPDGLYIQAAEPRLARPIMVDFGDARMRHRRRGGGELLSRSCGVRQGRHWRVLDATAGLGRDAFVLADLGCEVMMCEQNPVIAALLADGVQRALAVDSSWPAEAAARLSLHVGEATAYLSSLGDGAFDVVYLDPMFPASGKSALAKKEMQLFQQLLGADDGEILLLDAARTVAKYRVVVKRGPKSPVLNGQPPNFQLSGKSVRFDIYTRNKLPV
jgi:16S rRNA (guanine1516-N2)-methyltransferase